MVTPISGCALREFVLERREAEVRLDVLRVDDVAARPARPFPLATLRAILRRIVARLRSRFRTPASAV